VKARSGKSRRGFDFHPIIPWFKFVHLYVRAHKVASVDILLRVDASAYDPKKTAAREAVPPFHDCD
jgi:hypothetical protein